MEAIQQKNPGPAASDLLALDATERVVSFRAGGVVRRHIFRPPTIEDARTFFRARQKQTDLLRSGSNDADGDAPTRALYETLCQRAEGYTVRGGVPLDSLAVWRERLPLAHRLRAVELLTQVSISRDDAVAEIDPEYEITVLEALWNEAQPGEMRQFSGLVHRFEPVTAEEHQAFRRDCAKSVVVGGSRKGLTFFPSPENVLLRIYDKKIHSVEGYACGGVALAAEDIAARMDPFHKVAAVLPFFSRYLFDESAPEPTAEEAAKAQQELARVEGGEDRAK